MQWETVAIPFSAGIQPNSRGRLLESPKLLTAQNCFFELDEGPQKRFGHEVRLVETPDDPPGLNGIIPPGLVDARVNFSLENPGLSEYWLHGYGLFNPSLLPSGTPGELAVSDQPKFGHLFGQFGRDSEVVDWDGFRCISYPDNPGGIFGEVSGAAVMPALRSEPISKSLNGQTFPDGVDTGTVKVVAWLHGVNLYYTVLDSVTGAPLVVERVLVFDTPEFVRVFSMGAWVHMLVQDSGTGAATLKSFHQDTPGTVVSHNMGDTAADCIDVFKIDEFTAVVGRIHGGTVKINIIRADGSVSSTYDADLDGTIPTKFSLAVDVNGNLGILWVTTDPADPEPPADPIPATVKFRAYEIDGTPLAAVVDVCDVVTETRVTLSDNYLPNTGETSWSGYVEDIPSVFSGPAYHYVKLYALTETSANLKTTRQNVQLASHAFRVGQRAYVWLTGDEDAFILQPTWFLCDEELLPIGKQLFGLAYQTNSTSTDNLPGVNWHSVDDIPAKDRSVFSGALGYRQRAASVDGTADPNGIWAEPSISFYALDFLPRIRSAQAGRSAYIAGAQLWAYDGTTIAEAGFHMAPESVTGVTAAGGNLEASKTYRYRVDLCAKNAQNEEIRSWSIITDAIDTDGSNKKVTLTIPQMPMTRRNSYFLVFRTEGDGTAYYLCSSRNPDDSGLSANNYLANSTASSLFTFTDNLSDANLLLREYHPANADNYIQPLPAPACELVTSGQNRLWLAGGELGRGEIAPSRLFQIGETPTFSPAVNIQIERDSEPVTAIGFVGQNAAFFRRNSVYTIESDGVDNISQGAWGTPRLALSDIGAVSQESLALAADGLYFQSPAGIRVLTPGGGLRPPAAGLVGGLGSDVDQLAQSLDFAGAIVVPKYTQIRWYSRKLNEPSLVVNYTKGQWTTWTGVECVGVTAWNNTAILSRSDGQVWVEDTAKYLDGDRTYEMVIKTGQMHGGGLADFQRVRRWMLFGDADTGLTLRYRLFYDERDYHGEEGTVDFNGLLNDSEWGDGNWGDGSWGDSNNPDMHSGLWFRDNIFRIRRRAARQKCSVFAIEFSDLGFAGNFAPVVLGLELGRKQGLDHIQGKAA